MYPKARTRTDYSTYYSTPHASLAWRAQSHRWIKPLMWIALGFITGVIYSQVLLAPSHDTLALASTEEAVSLPKQATSQDDMVKSSSV